jgi:DNA-binding FadR family transcriptional regulator
VPAARLAAMRHNADELERLRESIPDEPLRLGTQKQFVYNQDFHLAVIEGSRNQLLTIAAAPVFAVLQRNLARSKLGVRFHRTLNEHHRGIVAAIEAGDADQAGYEMYGHLEWLRPYYERAWRSAR